MVDYTSEIKKLNEEESAIFKIIPYGEDHAIKNRDITIRLGLSTVAVRQRVHDMRKKGVLIGSNRNGFFLIENKADYVKTINQLKHRAEEITEVINILEKNGYKVK